MRSASASAPASAPPVSVSTLTRPTEYPRSASMESPVSIISRATLRGSARGPRNKPPHVGISPRFTSGRPNVAVRDATTRSQASTISNPPPTAKPSTAAISGFARLRRMMPYSPPRALVVIVPVRSVPAENTLGVPVRMPTQSSGSSSSVLSAASIPRVMSSLIALRFSSRSMCATST